MNDQQIYKLYSPHNQNHGRLPLEQVHPSNPTPSSLTSLPRFFSGRLYPIRLRLWGALKLLLVCLILEYSTLEKGDISQVQNNTNLPPFMTEHLLQVWTAVITATPWHGCQVAHGRLYVTPWQVPGWHGCALIKPSLSLKYSRLCCSAACWMYRIPRILYIAPPLSRAAWVTRTLKHW